MAYSYARGSYFDSEKLWSETELTEPLDSFTASSQYYHNQTTISELTIQDGSFVTNDGTILSGTVKNTGTLYVTGGNAAGVVVQDGGWLGITIDAAYIDEINFSLSAASAAGSESIDFSYQNTKQVSYLTIPGFCGLAIEGEHDGKFAVSNISVKGRLELDEVQAENISVLRQGGLLVHMGTTIKDLTISIGGNAYIKNGMVDRVVFSGKLRLGGTLHLHNYKKTVPDSVATVTGTLIFDLTDRATTDDFMVDALDSVACNSFALCVPGKRGVYKLADGAYNFDRTITVYSGDKSLGALTVGKTLTSGNNIYSLKKYDGALTLTVDDYGSIRQLNGNVGNIQVKSGETAYLNPGAKANNIQIDRGGVVIVQKDYGNEPKISGTITVAGQLNSDRGKLNGKFSVVLDVSSGVIPQSPLIVRMEHVATMDFNICVSADQKAGKYILANGLEEEEWPSKFYFGIGTKNKYTNLISPTKSYSNANNKYTLSINNDTLYLTVTRNEAPAAPTVKASTTAPTNKNVTITATFSKDSAKKQYSTNNKNWSNYSKAITAAKNGTYYFRGIDKNGKASAVVTFKVANIDKVAPNAPTVKANTTKLTNKNVTITASFTNDSKTKQYSTDKKSWKNYSKALSVDKNATYYFRGIDAARNISKVASIKVANIDKVAPKAPTVKLNSTKATNKSVTITAKFSGDTKTKQYSTDSKTWKSCSGKLTVSGNGTYYFRGFDAAGNVSKVASIQVKNIDKTAPAAPTVKLSSTDAAKKTVTIAATYSGDTKTKQYSTDNKKWNNYSKAITVKSDATYYFRGIDAAGNISKVTSAKVSTLMNIADNSWKGATELTGATNGALDTKLDTVDYYNVGAVAKLMLDMEAGKAKATFCDGSKQAVAAKVRCADGSEKTLSSLTLVSGDKVNDNITLSAIDDAVKYLKIENAGTYATYKLAKLA